MRREYIISNQVAAIKKANENWVKRPHLYEPRCAHASDVELDTRGKIIFTKRIKKCRAWNYAGTEKQAIAHSHFL